MKTNINFNIYINALNSVFYNHMTSIFTFLISIFLLTQSVCQTTEILKFKSFDISDGLSQNSVYDLTTSKDGMVWVATIDGLNRYDGNEFMHFKPNTTETKGYGSVIHHLNFYNDRILLLGMAGGLLCFDTKTGEFELPEKYFPNFSPSPNTTVRNTWIEKDVIYLCSSNRGLLKYNIKNRSLFSFHDVHRTDSIIYTITKGPNNKLYCNSENSIFSIENDHLKEIDLNWNGISKSEIKKVLFVGNKMYLVLKGHPLCFIDNIDNEVKQLKYAPFASPTNISAIQNDHQGNLLLGTRNSGIYKIDLIEGKSYKSSDDHNISGLRSNFILNIYEDSNNTLWVGTSGGGFAMNLNQLCLFQQIKPSILNPKRTSDDMVLGIHVDESDNIYMGGLYEGLKIYNPNNGNLEIINSESLPREAMNIYGFHDRGNIIYLATWLGLVSYNKVDKTFVSITSEYDQSKNLYDILALDSDTLLLGGNRGLLKYSLKKKEFHIPELRGDSSLSDILIVRHMQHFNDEEILLATTNYNLVLYNTKSGTLTKFDHLIEISRSARHFHLTKAFIWLATDEGLVQVDRKTFKAYKHWRKIDGLANDFIYAVLEDDLKHLWVSTNLGLSKINPANNYIANFDLLDGIQGYEFNTAAALKAKDGNLYFGGTEGMNIINPSDTTKSSTVATPQVTSIYVNNKIMTSSNLHNHVNHLSLPYDSNYITIHYSTPQQWAAKTKYWYKLEGLNEKWIFNDSKTYSNYTELSPGDYTFLIRAEEDNGFSHINRVISISIRPAFWQTWWFKILIGIILLGTLMLIYQYLLNQREARYLAKNKILQLESSLLRSQMNPHFIFNTLNSIKHYTLFKDKEQTSQYITDFSVLVRNILENSAQQFVTLGEEVDILKLYISIEQKRFRESFDYEINIDESLDMNELQIPPLLLQPYVENAIWHGLMPKAEEKKLLINILKTEQGFRCEIIDNGVGRYSQENDIKKKTKTSLGTRITTQRIEQLNKLSQIFASIQIIDLISPQGEPKGTKVIIQIDHLG